VTLLPELKPVHFIPLFDTGSYRHATNIVVHRKWERSVAPDSPFTSIAERLSRFWPDSNLASITRSRLPSLGIGPVASVLHVE
jgi:hypothetical protein